MLNEKGQEIHDGKPVAIGIRGLNRPLTAREEMQKMILEYDAQRRALRARIGQPGNDDDLVLDDEDRQLTDAEMEYQLSVAEADARRREKIVKINAERLKGVEGAAPPPVPKADPAGEVPPKGGTPPAQE